MRISNTPLLPLVLLAAFDAWHATADDLKLAGGDARLSGVVRSISPDGVVKLASELSAEPLLLKSGSVEKIDFSSKAFSAENPSTLVELANGDILPATIESLDSEKLTVVSPETGRLEIPRDRVKSLQLGIQRRKLIYQGPRTLEEWSEGGGEMKNWNFENGSLISSGPSVASKTLPLTRQFVMSFTLVWQKETPPNFQIYLADPLVAKGETCNRYYFQFNAAGMEIKRESTKGNRYKTIAIFHRSADQFADHRVRVTIMINRDTARLQLMLNGENEGEFADPIPDVPDGTGIRLACNTPNNGFQEIRDIEILEYDDSRKRHRNEERGDPANDSLISTEDDRWTGRLIGIRKKKDGASFVFKTSFQEKPVEIPESEVSTVFLSGEAADDKRPPFVLRLPGEGLLGVSSCEFTDGSASAIHPLLGPLNFPNRGILSIERNPSAAGTSPNP